MGVGGAPSLEVREGWLWGSLLWQVLGTVQNEGVGERGGSRGSWGSLWPEQELGNELWAGSTSHVWGVPGLG